MVGISLCYVQKFCVTKNLVTPDYVFKVPVCFQFGRSAKISFRFGSISEVCKFLSVIVARLGRILLYVTVSGKCSVLDNLILFSDSFLGMEIARLICVVVSVLL